jgi:hypothetical protein
MPKLVGTEDWNTESVREKVGYLMDSITDADNLARTFTAVAGRPDSQDDERAWNAEVRDLRLERLTEATALLFVSDQVEFAQRLLADPGWVLNGRPSDDGPNVIVAAETNIRQFVRLSLFATLANEGEMRGEGGMLRFETEHYDLRLFWPGEPDTEFIAVLPTLYSIAVASKSRPEILHILSDLIVTAQERFGGIDLFERPEYRLLGIYGLPSLDDRFGGDALAQFALFDGVLALRELERRYSARIRHMERDTYHWSQINSTGDLVDWALLIAEVAALRNGFKPFFPDNIEIAPEIRFCWDLATALA